VAGYLRADPLAWDEVGWRTVEAFHTGEYLPTTRRWNRDGRVTAGVAFGGVDVGGLAGPLAVEQAWYPRGGKR
jgi:hypothetical protein